MQYLGIDWGTRRAAWCAVDEQGGLVEGMIPADENGLARLVHALGPDVRGCMEMMSGAVWVRERLRACGWEFQIADARKVKAIAPLACKTDRVDARVLAQLARRDLIPAVWVPTLSDRELRERLRRRAHLVRLKTSARNRMFGLLTQWGLRGNLKLLRQPGSLERLAERGVPAVWIQSLVVLLEVVDDLERQLAAIDAELGPVARADRRVQLLVTIPGIGEPLGLTIAAEIGEISRFSNARMLIGYAGLAPTIKQSGRSSWTGRISKGRIADAAMGRDRSRPALLAADQPVESALPPDDPPARQSRSGEGGNRSKDPDRLLACPRAPAAVQAPRSDLCQHPFRQAPPRSRRLTAPMRPETPEQLKPTICAAKRRNRTQRDLTDRRRITTPTKAT